MVSKQTTDASIVIFETTLVSSWYKDKVQLPRPHNVHGCLYCLVLTSARRFSRFVCWRTRCFMTYTASAAPMARQPTLQSTLIRAAPPAVTLPSLQTMWHTRVANFRAPLVSNQWHFGSHNMGLGV
jgi:hypothetical protein